MKKWLLPVFSTLFIFSANAQTNFSLVNGSTDSINSKFLNEKREFWIHLPPAARDSASAKKRFPVIYLLDGDWNFPTVTGMTDFLSSRNGNDFCPEMIVVGIPNTNRRRDLTPTKVGKGGWIDSATARNSGGAEMFMTFIEKELIPHIDSLYPTTSYRILIGHSLGGLTVIHTLVQHKDLFRAYLAIDPSMWWDSRKLLKETELTLHSGTFKGTSLFLAMANTIPEGLDSSTVQKDTTEGTIHPRSILQLSRFLVNNPQNDLRSGFKFYPAETHSSLPLTATYDALHFFFSDFQLHFKDSYFSDSSFRLAAFVTDYYSRLSSEYGILSADGRPSCPPEQLVEDLGRNALNKKQFVKSSALFELNAKNFPLSSHVYDALADLYAARGERIAARAAYKKSLSLKETVETRKKLEKLK